MKQIRSIAVILAFLCALLFAVIGQAEEKTVLDAAKWMPEHPAGAVVIDFQTLKIKAEYEKIKEMFKNVLPRTLTGPNELTVALPPFESFLDVLELQIDKLSAVGATKAYLFIDSQDFDNPQSFITVIPTDAAKSKDVQNFAAEFSKGDFIPEEGRESWQKSFFVKAYNDCIVLAPNFKNDNFDEKKQKQFFKELELKTFTASNNSVSHNLFCKLSAEKKAAIQAYLFAEGQLAKNLEDADRALSGDGPTTNLLTKGIRAVVLELDAANSDLRLQIVSADEQSATALYDFLPVVKKIFLDRNSESTNSLEARLLITDAINHALFLFDPVVKNNTLNWSSKTVLKRLESLLPKITLDRTAGLYAPVTESVKAEADRIYSLVAPFINKQTAAVVHLDAIDLGGAFEKAGIKVYGELKRLLPETFSGKSNNITQIVNYVQIVLEDIDNLFNQIDAVGGRDVFVILAKDAAAPVKIIVPFDKEKKADAKKLFYFLRQMRFLPSDVIEEQESRYFRTVYKNCLIFGIKNVDFPVSKDDFNSSLKEFEAQDVPEIRQAFELSWSYNRSDKKNPTALSRIQAILNIQALTNDIDSTVLQTLRAKLEDEDPELAELLPAFTDQQLADGVKTAVVEIHPEKLFMNIHVISKDEQSAKNFAEFLKDLKPLVAQGYLKNLPEDAPAVLRDYYLDYIDSFFDQVLEVRGNVLSIRSNNVSERSKAINSWVSENCSMTAIGATGVAVGLLLPAVASARESARRLQNANNYKQMSLGMLVYHEVHAYFPVPYTVNEESKRLHSWRVTILPYLGQRELYDQIRLDEPWDSEWNKQFHDKCPKVFQNPSVELAPGETTYAVVVGENTAFPGNKRVSLATITDGCSNTAMIVERSPVCWMDPNSDIPFEEAIKGVNVSPNGIHSYYKGSFSLALCDGCVLSLPDNVSSKFLRKLFERNDGKIIDLDNPELNEQ